MRADRQAKGFNAVLLMTVQPDMRAVGPRDRTADEGFDVGFEDLPTVTSASSNPGYFQHLRRPGRHPARARHRAGAAAGLLQGSAGRAWTSPARSSRRRSTRATAATSSPATAPGRSIYLVGADGSGHEPQFPAGGAEMQTWDCYGQPTGIHYRPHADNRACQDADWLDFQWCQTGHGGEHVPERVADMWRNTPAKGVATASRPTRAPAAPAMRRGWWQGHEAWSNLCAGGTMGVVYGAAQPVAVGAARRTNPATATTSWRPDAVGGRPWTSRARPTSAPSGRIMRDLPLLRSGTRLVQLAGQPTAQRAWGARAPLSREWPPLQPDRPEPPTPPHRLRPPHGRGRRGDRAHSRRASCSKIPASPASTSSPATRSTGGDLMHTRTLGQGLEVSAVGLGCMGMSQSYGPNPGDRDDMIGVLRARRGRRGHLLRHRRGLRAVRQRGARRRGAWPAARPGRHRHQVRLATSQDGRVGRPRQRGPSRSGASPTRPCAGSGPT